MRFKIPAFVALFLLACMMLAADTPKSTITVSVTNQFDKPVENAAVILDFLGGRDIKKFGMHKSMHWEVHTNQHGIAHFPPVPYGTVQVQVITKKYQTFGQKFDLDQDEKRIEVKLNPPQEQYSAHPPLKPAEPPKQ